MNIEKMRAEFEAWFQASHLWAPEHDPLVKDVDGEYTILRVHDRWRAWQASRAALVIELPKRYESDYGAGYYEDDNGDLYQVTDIARAIEAAGVKCK